MNYTYECIQKFSSLPNNLKKIYGGRKAYKIIKDLEETFSINLAFVLILLALKELEIEDLPYYLRLKYKISKEKSDIISQEIESRIVEIAEKELAKEEEERIDLKVKNEDIIFYTFSENFIDLLNSDASSVDNFNIACFKAFNENELFEEKVIKSFYNNNEKISDQIIKVEDRETSATIKNYLKDFIKVNGSEMPDNLVLANYLNLSPNTKNLSKEEKGILNRVLKTYKNLVFFPDSMAGVPVEYWELVPKNLDKDSVSDVLSGKEEKNEKIDLTELKIEKKENEKEKIKKEEVDKIKDLDKKSLTELEEMLQYYLPNTLEYKAIKQEIKHLKNK